MSSNFVLNNEVTYRENRYRGWSALAALLLLPRVRRRRCRQHQYRLLAL